MGLLINARPTKLSHLASAIPNQGHRTSHARFLASDWDAPGVLAAQAERIIRQMQPGKGEATYLLIDDIRIRKCGKTMDAVSKIWDQKTHSFMRGHVVVTAAIYFRGVSIPWAVELWIPKAQAGSEYRKLSQIAVSLIQRFPQLGNTKVRVLFDAAYLAVHVTKACESRGFTWFSVAARNRNLFRRGNHSPLRDLSIAQLACHIPERVDRSVRARCKRSASASNKPAAGRNVPPTNSNRTWRRRHQESESAEIVGRFVATAYRMGLPRIQPQLANLDFAHCSGRGYEPDIYACSVNSSTLQETELTHELRELES